MPVIMQDEMTGPMARQLVNIIKQTVKGYGLEATPWVGHNHTRLYNVLGVSPLRLAQPNI